MHFLFFASFARLPWSAVEGYANVSDLRLWVQSSSVIHKLVILQGRGFAFLSIADLSKHFPVSVAWLQAKSKQRCFLELMKK